MAAAAACAGVAGPAIPAQAAPAGGSPSSHVSTALVLDPKASTGASVPAAGAARQQLVPDLIAAAPGGITAAQLSRIKKLGGVAAVLPVDGGKVMINGHSADVLGVSPQDFRAWTPLAAAAS